MFVKGFPLLLSWSNVNTFPHDVYQAKNPPLAKLIGQEKALAKRSGGSTPHTLASLNNCQNCYLSKSACIPC